MYILTLISRFLAEKTEGVQQVLASIRLVFLAPVE